MTKTIDQNFIHKESLKVALDIAHTNPGLAASIVRENIDNMKIAHFQPNSDYRRIVNLLTLAYNNFEMKMISKGMKRIEQALSVYDGIRRTRIHDKKLLQILDDARLYAAMGNDMYAKAKLTVFLKFEPYESATFELSEAFEMLGDIFMSEHNYVMAGRAFYKGMKVRIDCCEIVMRNTSCDVDLERLRLRVDSCKKHCVVTN